MYLKFKDLGVFENLVKTHKPNYIDISIKFKAWKSKMGYTNAKCAEVLNVSVSTVKRLASGKIKPFTALYERLKKLK